MLIPGTEMYLLTAIFIFLELLFFFHQFIYYLYCPSDKGRFWYLTLLGLLIVYNVTGGFFPDPHIKFISLQIQNIIAYGAGFLMASYFPFFFYKCFNLKSLRFHALYGVPLFLLLPYMIFFGVIYLSKGDLEYAIRYGMIVPFFYSFVIIIAILKAIRRQFAAYNNKGYVIDRLEIIAVYCAVIPWVSMSVFAYFHVSQYIEAIVTNLGFLLVTVIFFVRSVRRARIIDLKLETGDRAVPYEEIFEKNLLKYPYTPRETEIIRLLRQGLTKEHVGEKLFIATSTVSRHVQNIHYKTDVSNRLELMRKLETE